MILFVLTTDGDSLHKSNKRQLNIDESLFEKIGNDDMDAFESLYNLTERTMYAYILSIVRNHEDTLDILQETYLKIRAAAHLYKPMGKPLAWMFTIAKNLYLSNIRSEKRYSYEGTVELENSLEFSYVTDPEDKIVLETTLEILAEDERQIVLLHAVSGLKHKEIAKSIGIPLSTALSKYHRALKKLKDNLKEEEWFR
ncbi:MAG: RNA polymerase sigma factor [Dethiosulfatibacter sp.]|nr:RNA polymerase sigma factor [Dethiosulfatibacter sp.]